MSPHVDMIQILHTQIGDVLRDADFVESAKTLSSDPLRAAIERRLADAGIDVTVISVGPGGEDALSDLEIQWQPPAGGPFQKQWFSLTRPTRG